MKNLCTTIAQKVLCSGRRFFRLCSSQSGSLKNWSLKGYLGNLKVVPWHNCENGLLELSFFKMWNILTLKIKVPELAFWRDPTEEPFWVPERTLSWAHFSLCEEHFNNLNLFSTMKNLLWNWKLPWMLKVLHGTSNASKEPLFLIYLINIKKVSDWKKNGSLKTCLANMVRQKYWHHRSHFI